MRRFGANKETQLMLYKALIRSRLDYGCQVYNTASGTSLKHLYVIQHSALRIALGAIKNTKTISLLVEAGETPLSLRRENLTLIYWARSQKHGKDFHLNKEILVKSVENTRKSKNLYTSRINSIRTQYGIQNIQMSENNDYQIPWLKTEAEVP